MKKPNRLPVCLFTRLSKTCFFCLTIATVPCFAQDDGDSGVPPPAMVDTNSPTAISTFADGRTTTLKSRAGKFAMVAANAGDTITVQFRVTNGATAASAESLDGATLSDGAGNMSVADGSGSFQLALGTKPGLYRIRLTGGTSSALLQYWIPDIDNPDGTPQLVQPQ